MKITNKQYAQSLYEAVSEMGANINVALKNFVNILTQHRQVNKADKIIKEFEKIWNKEKGIMEGDLVSARKLDEDAVKLLNSQIVKLLSAKEVNLKNKIDKNIVGGFTARLGDTVIDGSLKTQLQSLKNKLVL